MTHITQGPRAVQQRRASNHGHPRRDGSKNSKTRPRQQPSQIDYRAINAAALAQIFWLLHRLLPGGIVQGSEYTVRNPMRADRKAGSFRINTKTGRWADFADFRARGGDIVSLVAFLNGCSQSEAARQLADMLGVPV